MKIRTIQYDRAINLVKDGKSFLLVGNDESARKFYKSISEQFGNTVIPFWTDKKYEFYKKCGLNICNSQMIDYNAVDLILISGYAAVAFYNNYLKTVAPVQMPVFELTGVPLGVVDYEWHDIK